MARTGKESIRAGIDHKSNVEEFAEYDVSTELKKALNLHDNRWKISRLCGRKYLTRKLPPKLASKYGTYERQFIYEQVATKNDKIDNQQSTCSLARVVYDYGRHIQWRLVHNDKINLSFNVRNNSRRKWKLRRTRRVPFVLEPWWLEKTFILLRPLALFLSLSLSFSLSLSLSFCLSPATFTTAPYHVVVLNFGHRYPESKCWRINFFWERSFYPFQLHEWIFNIVIEWS